MKHSMSFIQIYNHLASPIQIKSRNVTHRWWQNVSSSNLKVQLWTELRRGRKRSNKLTFISLSQYTLFSFCFKQISHTDMYLALEQTHMDVYTYTRERTLTQNSV